MVMMDALTLALVPKSWSNHGAKQTEKQAIMTSEQTTLLNGRVTLFQTADGLRASMDSVLLAAAVSAQPKDMILDMGCGTGAVGLCINERLRDLTLSISGIDIQDRMILLAERNAKANAMDHRCWYRCADVADKGVFDAEAFDHIVMNPPYYEQDKRIQSPDPAREIAYSGDLSVWMASALHWLRQGGSLCLIHRADALNDILMLAHKKFGAIEVWPVHSKGGEPAIRVIVKMIRNRKTPLTLHPPLVMFDADGAPSAQSNALLRDGAGLV